MFPEMNSLSIINKPEVLLFQRGEISIKTATLEEMKSHKIPEGYVHYSKPIHTKDAIYRMKSFWS